MLLYASFNHVALSDWFIFTGCSKYTRALVHSYLIGWGLIWFPALGEWKQSGDVVTVFCYTLSVCRRHFSQLFVVVSDCRRRGRDRCDLAGSDPEQLISYRGWEEVYCVHMSRVLMYLCCVWVQVIMWGATVSQRVLFSFWGVELGLWWLIHLSGRRGSPFLFTRSWSIKGQKDLQQCFSSFTEQTTERTWIHVSLLEAPCLNMPHTAAQSLILARTSSCQQAGGPTRRVDKLNRAYTDLRLCFVYWPVTVAGHAPCLSSVCSVVDFTSC